MDIFTDQWLGIRLFIWLYFFGSVAIFSGVMIYFFRERIKKKYYEIRFPERLLKVVIHYKNNMYKEYWRLIPELKYFVIEGNHYEFDDDAILKENDFFIRGKPPKQIIKIGNNEYEFNNLFGLKNRWRKYQEIHYYYNSPMPLNFDLSKEQIEFSSKSLQEFKENDLFRKLLTLDTEKNLLTFILIVVIMNIIGTIFIISKIMEWI